MTDIESNVISNNDERKILTKLKKRFISVFFRREVYKSYEEPQRYALVYGGYGALGSKCISQLKMLNWWVASVDSSANLHADVNILIEPDDKVESKVHVILASLGAALGSNKLEVVICTTETRISGKENKVIVRKSEEMWTDNMLIAMICAKVAARYLKNRGVFILTGAIIALYPWVQSQMIFAKSSVEMLMRTLLSKESGLPDNAVVVAVLPATLDTEYGNHNYCLVPEAGFCTPLQFLSDLIVGWARGKKLPTSGSICHLITNNFKTDIIIT